MLLVEQAGALCFFCKTCSYQYALTGTISRGSTLRKKQVEPILGSKESLAGADTTEKICPRCGHNKAYWVQVQIRSADEPMTEFYRCCQCDHQWREN